jgi:predicted small lipoprotein YifL
MKKFLSIITIIIISLSLAACGAKNPASNSNTATSKTKITYTKDFTYLPSYNGIKSTQYTPPTKKTSLATARYTINNTTDTKVFENYENTLKQDGWTITNAQKYFAISAKKGTHTANILVQKSGKNVLLVVISK